MRTDSLERTRGAFGSNGNPINNNLYDFLTWKEVHSIELLIAAFLGIMLFASYVSQKTRLPYTLVLVFVGVALTSLSASFIFGPFKMQVTDIVNGIHFEYDQLTSGGMGGLFVGLIVPPLLFEAMMHINSSDLKHVIKPSLAMATAGVVISTLVVGVILWKLVGLSFYVSFLFAALISPTDTATVLSIFQKAKVPSRLSTLMDMESALNDATAIVIFSVILASVSLPTFSFLPNVESFALIFGGGAIIGLLISFLAEIMLGALHGPMPKTLLTIFAVYGSYIIAISFGFSGLVAVTIVGLYFGNLTIHSAMGPDTRELVRLFWQMAAFVGTSVAFLFIGLQTNILELIGSIGIIAVAYVVVMAARSAAVYPILTSLGRDGTIPNTWKNVAMLGGMRGALSVALAASIPVSLLITQTDISTISALVLGVAFISITLQAFLLSSYIGKRFPRERDVEFDVRLKRALAAIETLQKLSDEGKIAYDTFVVELEKGKDELREVLSEIHASSDVKNIFRNRTSKLFSTVVNVPKSGAMLILRKHKMEESIEKMVREKDQSEPGDKESR